MQISGDGAAVGAIVGFIARPAVVLIWLGPEIGIYFALPSAAIGALVGGIAGGTGRTLWGALGGAVLSAILFEMFMCSCASMAGTVGSAFGQHDAGQKVLVETAPYFLMMGLAGAIAGGVGGAVGSFSRRADERLRKAALESANKEPTQKGSASAQIIENPDPELERLRGAISKLKDE